MGWQRTAWILGAIFLTGCGQSKVVQLEFTGSPHASCLEGGGERGYVVALTDTLTGESTVLPERGPPLFGAGANNVFIFESAQSCFSTLSASATVNGVPSGCRDLRTAIIRDGYSIASSTPEDPVEFDLSLSSDESIHFVVVIFFGVKDGVNESYQRFSVVAGQIKNRVSSVTSVRLDTLQCINTVD